MKRYIAVLELESDEESIKADVKYNYSSNGKDYSIIENVWFEEESKEKKMKTYEDGLNEAWELARDIISADNTTFTRVRKNVFGDDAIFDIIRKYSASEVIKKIKEYEEIKVGDEVVDKYGWKKVVTKTHENGAITLMDSDGNFADYYKMELKNFKKTGRNFSQIEEVLKQLVVF